MIGIIANPKAGKGWRELESVHRFAVKQGITIIVTNHLSEISRALIKLLKDKGVKILMVYGGDGTLQKVIDILIFEKGRGTIQELPLIVSLGGGTMLAVHKWLGWKTRPVEIIRKIQRTPLAHLPQRKLRPLLVRFTNEQNEAETRYGFIFNLGAIARIIERYSSDGRSVQNAVKHLALGVCAGLIGFPLSHKRMISQFSARVSADDAQIEQDKPLAMICSVTESLLFGASPFVRPRESNQFYAICYEQPALKIALLIPALLRGSFIPPSPKFFNRPVFSFEMTARDEQMFNLDGEVYYIRKGTAIRVELGPEIDFVPCFQKR
jgi:diacylglycerol kinase family enzyme